MNDLFNTILKFRKNTFADDFEFSDKIKTAREILTIDRNHYYANFLVGLDIIFSKINQNNSLPYFLLALNNYERKYKSCNEEIINICIIYVKSL